MNNQALLVLVLTMEGVILFSLANGKIQTS
jgi:hypothetical protein